MGYLCLFFANNLIIINKPYDYSPAKVRTLIPLGRNPYPCSRLKFAGILLRFKRLPGAVKTSWGKPLKTTQLRPASGSFKLAIRGS